MTRPWLWMVDTGSDCADYRTRAEARAVARELRADGWSRVRVVKVRV